MVDDLLTTPGIFELQSRYEPFSDYAPGEKPRLGAAGTRVYEITGLKQGSALFRLAYARVWEYNGDWDNYDGTKYSYEVTVRE